MSSQTCQESKTQVGRACRLRADDAAWWENLKSLDAMLWPVVHLLRVIDSMEPCIGKVYEAMDRTIEKLSDYVPDTDRCEEIRGLCEKRWNAYYSPLHAAAFMLDPEFQGKMQENDKEISNGWRIVLERLVPDAGARRKIKDQLSLYRTMKGSFGHPDALNERKKIGAALWWEDYGSDGPELQRLAIRILSQACSTSCLEQLWSVYSHVASKKRNRLGVQRANDLVFVSSNLRMLCKSVSKQADPFTVWEMAHQDPSTTDELLEDMMEDVDNLEEDIYVEEVEIQPHPDASTSGS